MIIGRTGRQALAVGAFLAVGFGLSACDPGHPNLDSRVKLQTLDEGRVVLVAADVDPATFEKGRGMQPGTLSETVARALNLGAIDGTTVLSTGYTGDIPAARVIRPTASALVVDITKIQQTLLTEGVRHGTTLFVSACNGNARGGASGSGAKISVRSSCGAWEGVLDGAPDAAMIRLANSSATVDWVKTGVLPLLALLVSVAGLWFMRRNDLGQRRVGAWLAIGGSIALAMVALFTLSKGAFDDAWMSAGQSLAQASNAPKVIGRTGLLLAVVMFSTAVVAAIHSARFRKSQLK
jgi:hypothetical protein